MLLSHRSDNDEVAMIERGLVAERRKMQGRMPALAVVVVIELAGGFVVDDAVGAVVGFRGAGLGIELAGVDVTATPPKNSYYRRPTSSNNPWRLAS